jgi:serpin B
MLSLLPALALTLSLTPSAPEGTQPAPRVQAVLTANNQFALDLYRQLRAQDGNLFFSPYSVNKALSMAYAGARGENAAEMARVLHFDLTAQELHRAYREARKLLNSQDGRKPSPPKSGRPRPAGPFYLSANLWGQQGYAFQKKYLNLLQECYGAGLRQVNFADVESARQTINGWAEFQTDRKIPDLFPPGALNRTTRLVLASAIYFKGDWAHPFDEDQTHKQPFWVNASRHVRVPLMNQTEVFGYFEDGQVQVLQMPYQGQRLAMVVLLPKRVDGLADLEKALTANRLAALLGRMRAQKVDVSLPKFKLTDAFVLNDALSALGMKRAFLPGGADFGGMNGGHEPLYVSAFLHKALIDVKEEGTEAAAASGGVVGTLTASAPKGVAVFRADHPFVFAIRDVRTGVILFLGRVARP